MAKIVCIHGIGQARESRETLLGPWSEAVCGGVSNAGGRLDASEIDFAFYGILFRPSGKMKDGGPETIPKYVAGDLNAEEHQILENMYSGLPAVETKDKGSRTAAYMVQAIARTPFFGNTAQNVVIWFIKQVRRYLKDPAIKKGAQDALLRTIGDDTQIILAHSLGTVVAYEVLCANPELPVRTLITLGSPLGMPAMLPLLQPPVTQLPGIWPPGIKRWVNVADASDVVALQKSLALTYGRDVIDYLVHNGATMHNVKPYLTAVETGRAIIDALSDSGREELAGAVPTQQR